MSAAPKFDLRPGVTEPVILMVSRRQVEADDLDSVLASVKPFQATREDAKLYRGQMTLVVDGYNDDPRELVDVPEVRAFLRRLASAWPHWAYFLNQVDDSLKLMVSCAAGSGFPGRGAVVLDPDRLGVVLNRAFAGMNELFDRYDFPESELDALTHGVFESLGLAD